ncbi:MAG: hypothetical protein P4L90_13235 [Rhodopila sp.]|nr:hypothetical protein [Rhodopila sp.]
MSDKAMRIGRFLDPLHRAIDRFLAVPPWVMGILFTTVFFLRRPQAILQADFWAEDGCVWYADAYEAGWRSLLSPHGGYLQTISRLVAELAQNFPLSWGPTIFAASALIIEALPPTLLISRRMDDAWPDRRARLGFALIYVLLPNAMEPLTNLTNSQWHLACLAFLIVTIRPSSSRLVGTAELLALAISGLSGPFSIFLLPIAVWQFLGSRSKPALLRVIILATCVIIQGSILFDTMSATRPEAPLGVGVVTLARIIALQIILGAALGITNIIRVSRSWVWGIDAVPLAIALVGGFLCLVALRRGTPLLRKSFVWAAPIFAAALITPVVSLTEPQWTVLTIPGAGNRYFLIPMLVWIAICMSLLHDRTMLVRGLAFGFIVLLPVGMFADFRYPESKPTGFAEHAREFERAPVGTRTVFPVLPPGFPPMVLTKH